MLIELNNPPNPNTYMFAINKEAYYHHRCDLVPEDYFYQVVREVLEETESAIWDMRDKPFTKELVYAAQKSASEKIISRLQQEEYNVVC